MPKNNQQNGLSSHTPGTEEPGWERRKPCGNNLASTTMPTKLRSPRRRATISSLSRLQDTTWMPRHVQKCKQTEGHVQVKALHPNLTFKDLSRDLGFNRASLPHPACRIPASVSSRSARAIQEAQGSSILSPIPALQSRPVMKEPLCCGPLNGVNTPN